MTKQIDDNINNCGFFTDMESVWRSMPEGGHEGDYLFIGYVQYRWNKQLQSWTSSAERDDYGSNFPNDLIVQRKLHVGESAEVEEDMTIHRDLIVEGAIKARYVKQPNCGLFANVKDLYAAYPDPVAGMWAAVGDKTPAPIWRCRIRGTWEATGEIGGVDAADLNNYTTKQETHDLINDFDIYKNDHAQEVAKAEERDNKRFMALENELYPLILHFETDTNIIAVGEYSPVGFSWTAKHKGVDVSNDTDFVFTDFTGNVYNNPKPFTSIELDAVGSGSPSVQKFKLEAHYKNMNPVVDVTATAMLAIPIVYRSYFGVVREDFIVSPENIPNLSLMTAFSHSSRTFSKSGINLNNQKICYAYPAAYGALTSITDGNGFNNKGSYNASPIEIQINNIPYYVYLTNKPTTNTGITQNYR